MPCISVIIPAYNAERTLKETVESVLNQTFSDIEIIIINDGSIDQTVDIAHNLSDPRIKVLSYENGGVCLARNRGISQAKGELISFIDSDDMWTFDKLETQLAALRSHPEAAVAYSWTSYLYEQTGKIYPGSPCFFEGDVYANLLKWNFLASGSNPLIRRQVIEEIGGFDPAFPPCEDWDFYLRLAAMYKFVPVPKHQIIYRQSSTSATASKLDFLERQCISVIEKNFQRAPEKYKHLKRESLAWVYEYCTQLYLQNSVSINDVNMATQKIWQAIKLRPQVLLEGYGQNLIQWIIKKYILFLLPLKILKDEKSSGY